MSKLGNKILKLIGAIFFISSILLVVSSLYIFNNVFSNLQVEVRETAAEAVSIIDGNKLEKVIKSKSMNNDEYKQIQDSMMRFKNDKNARYLYTLAKGNDNSTYFVVDASLTEPSPLGEEYPLEEEMIEAFNGKTSFTKKPYTDGYGTFITGYAPVKNSSGEIIAIVAADADVKTYSDLVAHFLEVYIIVGIAILFLAVISSLIFSKKVSANVGKIKDALSQMSEGDLTVALEIRSNDEFEKIAEYINNFKTKTADIISGVVESSKKVEEHTENLFNASQEIACSSEVVTSSIEEVAKITSNQSKDMLKVTSSLDEFGAKINQTADIVQGLNAHVEVVDSKVKESGSELGSLENSIRDISESFDEVRDKIQGLNKHLSQINEITNLINSIADQTNLLALNAAIEAARAGDVGRGFSVVADEIRKLAEQSKTSSANINLLLGTIIKDGNTVIEKSDNMNNKLHYQENVLNTSLGNFKEIVSYIENMLPQIKAINNNVNIINSEKQEVIQGVEATAAASEEISASNEEITASSQELSAASQGVASSVERLKEMAKDMANNVNHFKI
jgi:methyl-accepting chemotaxis protein